MQFVSTSVELLHLNWIDIRRHFGIFFRQLVLRLSSGDNHLIFFSSPEPKAQVSYCHSAPSVVRPSVNFHIFNFFSRTAWWILMKLGRDEVLMIPYKCCCFSDRSAKGRIQGGAKIGHGGPLLQESSSSDRKATATNRMDSNDLEACGKKCCYFWFHSEVKFLTRFWRLFGLSHFCIF